MKTSNDNLVKIAVNKSLLKEFFNDSQRTVYMKNGSEFQIQIFNPYTYTIGASISINGKEMPNQLVIKPGQRIWLERYLNEARKFLFETYEVNDSQPVRDAIAQNGVIEVKFYKEKEQQNYNLYVARSPQITYYNDDIKYGSSVCNSYCSSEIGNASVLSCLDASTTTLGLSDSVSTATTAMYSATSAATSAETPKTRCFSKSIKNDSIETGRVEKGSYSNQKLRDIIIDFEYWAFRTETIHILPESRKPIHAGDLKKSYCSNCGRKLNTKYKFCPYCGNRIE